MRSVLEVAALWLLIGGAGAVLLACLLGVLSCGLSVPLLVGGILAVGLGLAIIPEASDAQL